jgi:phage terminase Nu1 subunit (DNA packaging protein)
MARSKQKGETANLLKGWAAIAKFLGLSSATAHRWAKAGMPVRREGRFTVADRAELQEWLGRESGMPNPAHVMTGDADISAALKESIAVARRTRKK